MEPNILIIVEGEKTESIFFKRLAEVFGLKFNIYCFSTNIYTLYKMMKSMDFNADIKDVLLESEKNRDNVELLSKKFAYTYLVFDADVHHTQKREKCSTKETILSNLQELVEMANYFVDETDPSIGKLYINYPMMESFRDADSFFDENYSSSVVRLDELKSYKTSVSLRKLNKFHLNKYTKDNYSSLILQNLFKLNEICTSKWKKPKYEEYIEETSSNEVLKIQKRLVEEKEILSVINTCLFLIVDYFGNQNGFYDGLKLSEKEKCSTLEEKLA